jgi:predicted ATPase
MSIDRIALKNFKCFRELDVEFSKITLLTGENSSGKSSLIYAILAILQSKFPFYLSPNGKYINLGDFEEISFQHSKDNQLAIDLFLTDADQKYCYETAWEINRRNRMPKLNYLNIKFDDIVLEVYKPEETYCLNLKGSITKKESLTYEIAQFVGLVSKYIAIQENENEFLVKKVGLSETYENINIENFPLESIDVDNISIVLPIGAKDWDKDSIQINLVHGVMMALLEVLDRKIKNFNFISSFRLYPDRTYFQKSKAENKIGKYGENHIDQILEWEDDEAEEFDQLNAILKNLGLLKSIKSKRIGGGRFEIRVKVKNNKGESLADVGFGISQLLPIIVADLQLSDDSTLAVAQPEIHLHPSVQATLADYFVQQIRETQKRYILETHSEYLMNRIRLSIVKGTIESSDVAVYYFENSNKGSIKHKIEFTKDGQIRNAPKGFFDTYMMDTMDIALNAE